MKQLFTIILHITCILFFSFTYPYNDSSPSPTSARISLINFNRSNDNNTAQRIIKHTYQFHNEFFTIDHHLFSLINMSLTQLKNYFDTHNYEQSTILQCIPLYQSDEFIKLIKTFDDYAITIAALYKKYKNAYRLQKLWWLLNNKYYRGFNKQLSQLNKEIKQQPPTNLIIKTLNNSNSYHHCAQEITTIARNTLNVARHSYRLDSDIQSLINNASDQLNNPNNEQQFVFNLALINHILTDIHSTTTHAPPPNNSYSLFKHALITFVTHLNPITQIHQWADFIINAAFFVTDTTIGKLYLSSLEYEARINKYSKAFALLSWNNFSKISAEQWIELGAHIAADCVYGAGMTKIVRYLKELNVVRTTQQHASSITNSLYKSLESKLTHHNFAITADGTIIKQAPITTGTITKRISTNVKIYLENMQQTLLQAVKLDLPALRKKYDLTRKGFGDFANKYIKINYEHILGMELFFKKGFVKIGGFHHDFMNAVEKSGIIEFSEKVMHKNGFYRARLLVNGKPGKHKASFFPAHWTREQVIDTIFEAYDNFAKNNFDFKWENGLSIFKSKLNNGIEIEICITKNGKIKTAYPLLS